jgi:putative intracellular protease/amidase
MCTLSIKTLLLLAQGGEDLEIFQPIDVLRKSGSVRTTPFSIYHSKEIFSLSFASAKSPNIF